MKVDREKQEIVIDEFLESVTVEELQVRMIIPNEDDLNLIKIQFYSHIFNIKESLPSHQPRFIVYAYKMIHDDRVSYPLCFIFYTPRDSQVSLLMFLKSFISGFSQSVLII